MLSGVECMTSAFILPVWIVCLGMGSFAKVNHILSRDKWLIPLRFLTIARVITALMCPWIMYHLHCWGSCICGFTTISRCQVIVLLQYQVQGPHRASAVSWNIYHLISVSFEMFVITIYNLYTVLPLLQNHWPEETEYEKTLNISKHPGRGRLAKILCNAFTCWCF